MEQSQTYQGLERSFMIWVFLQELINIRSKSKIKIQNRPRRAGQPLESTYSKLYVDSHGLSNYKNPSQSVTERSTAT